MIKTAGFRLTTSSTSGCPGMQGLFPGLLRLRVPGVVFKKWCRWESSDSGWRGWLLEVCKGRFPETEVPPNHLFYSDFPLYIPSTMGYPFVETSKYVFYSGIFEQLWWTTTWRESIPSTPWVTLRSKGILEGQQRGNPFSQTKGS